MSRDVWLCWSHSGDVLYGSLAIAFARGRARNRPIACGNIARPHMTGGATAL